MPVPRDEARIPTFSTSLPPVSQYAAATVVSAISVTCQECGAPNGIACDGSRRSIAGRRRPAIPLVCQARIEAARAMRDRGEIAAEVVAPAAAKCPSCRIGTDGRSLACAEHACQAAQSCRNVKVPGSTTCPVHLSRQGGGRTPKLSPAQIAQAKVRRENGETLVSIAADYGVSVQTLGNWLRRDAA